MFFPGGKADVREPGSPIETLLETARRELFEETGLLSDSFRRLGSLAVGRIDDNGYFAQDQIDVFATEIKDQTATLETPKDSDLSTPEWFSMKNMPLTKLPSDYWLWLPVAEAMIKPKKDLSSSPDVFEVFIDKCMKDSVSVSLKLHFGDKSFQTDPVTFQQ